MSYIDEESLPGIYESFRSRYESRDDRMAIIDAVVAGDWSLVDPDNEKLISRSPNLLEVALLDTAESAGALPTIRVMPRKNSKTIKEQAARQERVAAGYFDFAGMELLVPQSVLDMAAFGLAVWVVWPDFDERLPFIEKRDPRFCYPEPGFRPGDEVKRCLFSREVHFSQLPTEYQAKVVDFVKDGERWVQDRMTFALVEYFDENEVVVAAMFSNTGSSSTSGSPTGANTYVPVILDRIENKLGVCQVVIGSRFSLDGEFRGQFDQIVGPLEAHVRLMAMVMDYADQAVYSDIWVKDLIGELSWGGGAYIELGPQGAIGRVPPAAPSFQVGQDLDRLVDAIHIGGRWPKSRPGQVDQCLAPETKVLTDDLRWVQVGDLKEGQKIAGFDEELQGSKRPRQWRTAEVTHVGRADLPSYRVKMADGTEIVASHGHKWLVRNNARHSYWLTTDELFKRFNSKRGIEVVKVLEPWKEDRSYEAGYLAGMLDGEGWLSHSPAKGGALCLGIAQRENAALAAVEVYSLAIDADFRRYRPVGQNGDVQQMHLRGGRAEIVRVLGSVRPLRLLDKWNDQGGFDNLGRLFQSDVAVVEMEFVGNREVVTLGTSTHTLVAEGYAHHNSIASAKFVEAMAGMMNTAIKTYHQLLSRMMEHALRLAFATDLEYFPGKKTASGILRNQEFVEEYDPRKDIDLRNKVRVEYGLGLGRDPAQSAVLMLNYAKEGYISKEFVKENIEGLTDVERDHRPRRGDGLRRRSLC